MTLLSQTPTAADIIFRVLDDLNEYNWRTVQVVDLRCVAKVVEKRAWFLRHNGERFLKSVDYVDLEEKFPDALATIVNCSLGQAENGKNVVSFAAAKRKKIQPEQPDDMPPPDGGGRRYRSRRVGSR